MSGLSQNFKTFAAWNNKIMKTKYGVDRGIGSWSGNDPQESIDPFTKTDVGPSLPIHGPNASEIERFNMNKVLLANIQRNDFFKSLAKYRTVTEIIDQVCACRLCVVPLERCLLLSLPPPAQHKAQRSRDVLLLCLSPCVRA